MAANKESMQLSHPPRLSGDEIRDAFLSFYAQRGHQVLSSASLIPEDPTVLLTIAGMLQFKPVFLGKEERPAERATTSQKCLRTNDIENVGRTARHHTFFEMLGNFSFGDYFKKEAIQWAWELSTEVFKLSPQNLVVSVYREDEEAEAIWRDVVGVNPNRIIRMDESDNFWTSGPTGPCGPCSEIYFDFNPLSEDEKIDLEDDERFIEFYNLVFMQYNRDSDGNLIPLENCNIDTGMGLERMAQILQRVPNNYETDLMFPLIQKVASIAGISYNSVDEKKKTSFKILADHSRAVTQLISDGVLASNLGRGYILRRLIRRMIRHARILGIDDPFLPELGSMAIDLMKKVYPSLQVRRSDILSELKIEEIRFLETLERGERLLSDLLSTNPVEITGKQAFELYDTYGFPVELTQEVAEEHNLLVDIKSFEEEMLLQRNRAKAASVSIDLMNQSSLDTGLLDINTTKFIGFDKLSCTARVVGIFVNGEVVKKVIPSGDIQIILDQTPFFGESGGQVGDVGTLESDDVVVSIKDVQRKKDYFIHSGVIVSGSLTLDQVVKAKVNNALRRRAESNHTATHLLQSALKKVVGESVGQRGSLVAFERLRFDFNSSSPVDNAQLKRIENLVNNWISEDHPIEVMTMPINQALEAGALAMFGEKYGEIVRVVDVPGVSMELCGGTHVGSTSDLGNFKIISESGVASGIRRIEAIAGPALIDHLNEKEQIVKQLCDSLKDQPSEIINRVASLQKDNKTLLKEVSQLREELVMLKALTLLNKVVQVKKINLLVHRFDGMSGDSLQVAALRIIDEVGDSSAIILGGVPEASIPNKLILVVAFGKEIISNDLHAGKFIVDIAKFCGGGGGGRPNIAQAGGRYPEKLDEALKLAKEKLLLHLS